jgi:hypothetical protein
MRFIFPLNLTFSLIASQESAVALLHSFRSKNLRLRALLVLLQCCRRAARAAVCIHSLKWVGFPYLLPARLFLSDSLDCYKTQIAGRNNRLLSLFALFLLAHIDSV